MVPTSELLCLRKRVHTFRSKCLSRRARASVSPPCQTAGPSPSVGNPTREGAHPGFEGQAFPVLAQQVPALWASWELNCGDLGATGSEIILNFECFLDYSGSLPTVTFLLSLYFPIPPCRQIEQSWTAAHSFSLAGNNYDFQVRKANFVRIKKWGGRGRKGKLTELSPFNRNNTNHLGIEKPTDASTRLCLHHLRRKSTKIEAWTRNIKSHTWIWTEKKTRRTYSKIHNDYLWVVGNSDCYFHFHFSVFSKLSITTSITLTKKKKPISYFTKKAVTA